MSFPALIRPCCSALILMAAVPVFAQDYDWGRKMLDKREIKFGSVAKNADVTFKVTVKNVFKEDIRVTNLWTSCGCISWQDRERLPITLKTGESQDLTIRLDTVRHQGDKNVVAYASLLEPSRGSTNTVSIPVQGRIRTDVVLQANTLNFGTVELGKAMEHRLNVVYTGGRPDWKITEVKVGSPYLSAKAIEKGRGGGTANYDVVVTLNSEAPVGKLTDRMMILTDDRGSQAYSAAIEAQVEPDIVVADIQLGQIEPGQAKTVNVVVRGKKPFKIEKIEPAQPDESFKFKFADGMSQIHMVVLTFVPSDLHGLFEEEFLLTIAGREQPVAFKAKGRVMDQAVTVAKPVTQP